MTSTSFLAGTKIDTLGPVLGIMTGELRREVTMFTKVIIVTPEVMINSNADHMKTRAVNFVTFLIGGANVLVTEVFSIHSYA